MIQDVLFYLVYLPVMFTAFGVAYFAWKEDMQLKSRINAYTWRNMYHNLTKR